MLMNIEMNAMRFYAYHGVLPQENVVGATYEVNLTLQTDVSETAYLNDQLSGTVNYAEVYEVVHREMDVPSQLLEHVCGRIATALLNGFSALQRVEVCVVKKNPPIEGAGVCESAVRMAVNRSTE
jgi:dihydroneopterin aldolase